MESGLDRAVDATDDAARLVRDDHDDRWFQLALLGALLFERRIGRRLFLVPRLVADVSLQLALVFLTLLLARLELALEVVRQDRPERRVGGCEVRRALKRLAREAERGTLDEEVCVVGREQRDLAVGQGGIHLP